MIFLLFYITRFVFRLNVVYKLVERQKLRCRLNKLQGKLLGVFCAVHFEVNSFQACLIKSTGAGYPA
jgi:hypothetical protein